jgi:hypothetical protein
MNFSELIISKLLSSSSKHDSYSNLECEKHVYNWLLPIKCKHVWIYYNETISDFVDNVDDATEWKHANDNFIKLICRAYRIVQEDKFFVVFDRKKDRTSGIYEEKEYRFKILYEVEVEDINKLNAYKHYTILNKTFIVQDEKAYNKLKHFYSNQFNKEKRFISDISKLKWTPQNIAVINLFMNKLIQNNIVAYILLETILNYLNTKPTRERTIGKLIDIISNILSPVEMKIIKYREQILDNFSEILISESIRLTAMHALIYYHTNSEEIEKLGYNYNEFETSFQYTKTEIKRELFNIIKSNTISDDFKVVNFNYKQTVPYMYEDEDDEQKILDIKMIELIDGRRDFVDKANGKNVHVSDEFIEKLKNNDIWRKFSMIKYTEDGIEYEFQMSVLYNRFKKQNFRNPYTNNPFDQEFIDKIVGKSNIRRKILKLKSEPTQNLKSEEYDVVEYDRFNDTTYVYSRWIIKARFEQNNFKILLDENGTESDQNFDETFRKEILNKVDYSKYDAIVKDLMQKITSELFETSIKYVEMVTDTNYTGNPPTFKEYESVMDSYLESISDEKEKETEKKKQIKESTYILLYFDRCRDILENITSFEYAKFTYDTPFIEKCFDLYKERIKQGSKMRKELWNFFFTHCTKYAKSETGAHTFKLLWECGQFKYCSDLLKYKSKSETRAEFLKLVNVYIESQLKAIEKELKEGKTPSDLEEKRALINEFESITEKKEEKPSKMKFDDDTTSTSSTTSSSNTTTSTTSTHNSIDSIIGKTTQSTMNMSSDSRDHNCAVCKNESCVLHTVDPDKKIIMGFCSSKCMENKYQ